ncbi:MAG: hypothetical protein ACYTFZ_10000, partial [Planctomycetota bacterium]
KLPEPTPGGAEVPSGARAAAVVFLVVVVAFVSYLLGRGLEGPGATAPTAPRQIAATASPEPGGPPPEAPPPMRSVPSDEGAAKEAFEKAMTDWERYSRSPGTRPGGK